MRRLLSALLVLGLTVGTLAACNPDDDTPGSDTGTTTTTSEQVTDDPDGTDPIDATEGTTPDGTDAPTDPEGTDGTEDPEDPSGDGGVRTGLGVAFSNANSSNADGDTDGTVDTQAYVAAVLVDADGTLLDVSIDALQSRFAFDSSGVISTDPDTTFETKQTLGDEYNMRGASGIGREWNEQADDFAAYVTGMTADEVAGIQQDDADLASSVTMKIGAMQTAVLEAIERSEVLGAAKGDAVGVGIVGSAAQTQQEANDRGPATAVAYNYYAASSFNGQGAITSQIIDASQAKFRINDDGTIETPLDTDFETKLELGPEYNMKDASPIGREWDEQARSFAEYVVGMTAADVAALPLADGKPADADLSASVTVTVDGFLAAVTKAWEMAGPGVPPSGEALRTGLGVAFSNANSRNAEGDTDGVVDTQAYTAAVLVDGDGRVVQAQIDALQSRFDFTAEGVITTASDTTYQTKQTLGDDYNMRGASPIGREWDEQADSFAAYIIGMTADEIAGIEQGQADLASTVTLKIGAMQTAVLEAIERSEALGATEGDFIGLGIAGSAAQTKQEADDRGPATAVAYNYYAAVTFDGSGVITSSVIDASQAKFEINEDGTIETPIDTDFETKQELGAEYGMKDASPLGREWDEQADGFAEYIIGKTAPEVTGFPIEDGKPTEADLLASVTVSIDGFQTAVAMAGQDALAASHLAARGEPVRIGLGVSFSQANSKDAEDGQNGAVDTQAYTAAVLVDAEGRVVRASIDAMQSKFEITPDGTVTTAPDTTFTSKQLLGDDYNMRQADSFAAWTVGKTADEIVNVDLDAADLSSQVTTLKIGAMQEALTIAIETAEDIGARSGDYIGLGIVGSANQTRPEPDGDTPARAMAYNHYAAVAYDRAGRITAAIIDASQAGFEINDDGTIATDLEAEILTKNARGDDYGMRDASGIGKEWNEQAAYFADYIVGLTAEQVTELPLTDGVPAEADLASGATVTVTDFIEAVRIAGEDALDSALADAGSADAVRTGLGVSFSNANSKDASDDADGVVDTQAYVAAVLVDADGTVVDVSIDALQSRFTFDTVGVIATTPDTAYTSKQLLGDDYNMRGASAIGREWNEQANDFEDYVTGRTADEIAALTGEEADLVSSVTVKLGTMQTAVLNAIEAAEDLGASRTDRIGVGVLGSANQTRTEADDENPATAVAYNYYAATSVDANGVITSQILDASQARFALNDDGTIETDLDGEILTKQQLGDDYGMRGASPIGREWDEQADHLADFVTGMTAEQVSGITGDEADLVSGVTVSFDGLTAAILQALDQAE